jgi:arylsulfatase A-like enzyme
MPLRGPRSTVAPCLALVSAAALLACDDASDSPPTAETLPVPRVARWRPNVVVVTLDTTRADALGCYGTEAALTPTIDALAARGVRFSAARATAPVTLPSHASIFTGTYPFQHGVRDNGTFVLSADAHTLAERLGAAGWQTAAFTAAFVLDSAFGLAQGFDRYDDVGDQQAATGGEGEERPAEEVVDRALAWLATADRGRPFFLWVHLFDPHFPYAPPADLLAAHPFTDNPGRRGNAREKARHLYRLEVAHADRQLDRLLAGLAPFGGADPTVVAIVGDHGEGLGDHGESTHAVYVYDSTILVPFLLAHATLPAGRVVPEPVSTIDLAPTLLAWFGLPTDGTFGADLGPLLRGEPFAPTRPVYFENCATWFTSGWAPLYGVIDGNHKVIVGPTVRAFDLSQDRDEKRDIAAAAPEAVARTRAALSAFADQTLAAVRHAPDSAELSKLNRLGYVQGGGSSGRKDLAPPGWQPERALTPEQGQENTRRFSQANQLWQQGQRAEAIEQLLALTREEPDNGHYAEIAAALLVELKRPAEAMPLAQRAVELVENPANRSTLVACLLALGRTDDALRELSTSVLRFPDIAAPRLQYARALIDAGRPSEVAAVVAPLLERLPADSPLRAQAQALLERTKGR